MQRNEQNIGETKKTSVRVHHAPGGNSSFSLGWGSDAAEPQQVRGRRRYGQANQQSGGGMRSEMNIGESNQTSVRVHNPPGGRGNFSLAHDPIGNSGYQDRTGGRRRYGNDQSQGNNMYMRSENDIGETNHTSVKVHNPPGGRGNFDLSHQNGGERARFGGGVAQGMQNAPVQRSEEKFTVDPSGNKFKPSVRVHNPPGGRSNIHFG